MKKFVVVLAILAIAVPSMAATTVSCAVNGAPTNTSAKFTVNYAYDAVGSFPRAFALDITTNLGTISGVTASKVGESIVGSLGFGIFPGTIVIDSTGSVTSAGVPVAPQADLPSGTLAGIGTAGATVELGSLYATTAAKPAASGTILTVAITCPLASAARTATITIVPNVARGGLVLEDATSAATFSSTCALAIPSGGPGAWNCASQLLGDGTGDGKVNAADLLLIKNAYGSSTGQPAYNCKADFTRDGKVNAADLLKIKNNYGVTNLAVCGTSTMTCN